MQYYGFLNSVSFPSFGLYLGIEQTSNTLLNKIMDLRVIVRGKNCIKNSNKALVYYSKISNNTYIRCLSYVLYVWSDAADHRAFGMQLVFELIGSLLILTLGSALCAGPFFAKAV